MKVKTTLQSLLVLCTVAFLSCAIVKAQPVISLNNFSGPYSNPVGIFNCGDDRLFIMEQLGYIFTCDLNGVKSNTPFLNIDSRVNGNLGEQGLLGMAFHPNYAANGYIYVNYTDNSGNTKVSRFTRSAGNVNLIDTLTELVLLTVVQPYANHNGGCMHFGKDGYLYIAMGDGGSGGDPGNYAQNDLEKLGKMLRIDVDNGSTYGIPSSNPYVASMVKLPEIWAEGLRNPWRWSFDSYTGDMWIGDVGQGTWEEINFQPASSTGGINYGWRCYEANHVYNTSVNCPVSTLLTFPVFEYVHSSSNGCSVTGGYVYRGGLNGELFGKYIFSDYCSGKMRMIEKTNSSTFVTTELNDTPNYEISSFGEDKNGELYVCYVSSFSIKKVSSGGCAPTAFIKGNATVKPCANTTHVLEAVYGVGLSYQWYRNNVIISGATSHSYPVTTSATYKVAVTRTGGCSAMSNAVKVTFSPTAKITASGPTTFCAGGNVTLSATSGSGYSYQWKRNNVNIPLATSANYIATQAGNYKVKITDVNGCTRTSNTITTIVNCKLAEQWQTEELAAELIPNPASSFVDVKLSGLPNHQYQVLLYDLVGKRINEYNILTNNVNAGSVTIDLKGLTKGVYNIIVAGETKNEYKKLIVQ